MDTRICTVVAFVVFLCLECLALKGPEQIHIAYGSTASEMVVMWSTSENSSSIVHYRHSSATNSTKVTFRDGECRLFTFGNEKGLQYIHWVHLTVRQLQLIFEKTETYCYVSDSLSPLLYADPEAAVSRHITLALV